jgi:hypothetical protein
VVRHVAAALRATGPRIVDIRVTENPGEVDKHVTKPGAYLSLDGDEWRCDSQTHFTTALLGAGW